MAFPDPPDPHDYFFPPEELLPEMSDDELRRQIEWREDLEAFAVALKDWWRDSMRQPIPEADATIVFRKQKLTLSKATLEWFEAARQQGERDAAAKLSQHILSSALLKQLRKR